MSGLAASTTARAPAWISIPRPRASWPPRACRKQGRDPRRRTARCSARRRPSPGAGAAARVREPGQRSTEEDREMQRKATAVTRGASPQLSNERLLRGFGTYGGEEHVSYMLVAEAKAAIGGDRVVG